MPTKLKKSVPHRTYLDESELPRAWYNIQADLPTPMPPFLHPTTHAPVTVDDLCGIFARPIAEQELTKERFIEIPDEVRDLYKTFRPSPLHRAYNLEKAIGTPARIYYKFEGNNPSGSHKLNSAVAQVHFNKAAGVRRITTETGGGQWGSALAIASKMAGLDCTVYMVKVSYEQKPYRRIL
ncbi:MAG: pyridoxal-phosphate dependent enzyme, partial [Myxococcaceae bacterium]|nr:pyridoxal-phosphate dependent enzyme [Myxococcaceae bacterium]